jgi:hypothetical protein
MALFKKRKSLPALTGPESVYTARAGAISEMAFSGDFGSDFNAAFSGDFNSDFNDVFSGDFGSDFNAALSSYFSVCPRVSGMRMKVINVITAPAST